MNLDIQDPATVRAIVMRLKEMKEREQARNKISSYFPDDGPLRRELYQRHLEFFAAGKDYTERCFMAANRCLTPWSPVETDHGERRIAEMIGETGFYVRSWDGSSQCTKSTSPVFLKNIEPAFQIHLDNGEVFQCSRRHRVWTPAASDGHRPSGWASIDQLIRASSGLHLTRTTQGWVASYGVGGRLCDGLPPLEIETQGAQLPKPHNAPSIDHSYSPEGEVASISEHTRVCRELYPLSIPARRHLIEDLCDKSAAPIALQFSLPRTLTDRIAHRSGCVLDLPIVEILDELMLRIPSDSRFRSVLLALHSPFLFNGRTIVAVVPLGYQPIVDFEVSGTHNYFGAGLVHHNSGKTVAGAYEMAVHLTGLYPHWWEGRRFDHAVSAWAAGDTNQTTRDILQAELLGKLVRQPGDKMADAFGLGTGMIPAHLIRHTTPKSGMPNAIEQVWVRHTSGGTSTLGFKAYEQGRESFQGVSQSIIWADEEVDESVYTEMLMRTMTTAGMIYITFTPLNGITPLVQKFLPESELPS